MAEGWACVNSSCPWTSLAHPRANSCQSRWTCPGRAHRHAEAIEHALIVERSPGRPHDVGVSHPAFGRGFSHNSRQIPDAGPGAGGEPPASIEDPSTATPCSMTRTGWFSAPS